MIVVVELVVTAASFVVEVFVVTAVAEPVAD